MKLDELPPDFWSIISEYLPTRYLCNLRCAGNKKLIKVLSGSVTTFIWTGAAPKRHPLINVVESFSHIRDFVLYPIEGMRNTFGDWGWMSMMHLRRLPSDLRTFIVPWTNIREFHLKCLPKTITRIEVPYLSGKIDVLKADMPPLLTHLKTELFPSADALQPLMHLSYLHVDRMDLTDESVSSLPDSLTTLILPSAVSLTHEGIPQLPRLLSTLRLHSANKIYDYCVPMLPSSLTELDLFSSAITPNSIPSLPTKLRLLLLSTLHFTSSLTDSHLTRLPVILMPTSLVSAELLTERCKDYLPKRLIESSALLPHQIRHLALPYYLRAHDEPSQKLPPIWSVNKMDDSHIPLICRDVEELWLGCAVLDPAFTKDLPPNLTSLSMPLYANLTAESISLLPRTLTLLIAPKSGHSWTDAAIQALPPNLLHLEVIGTELTDDAMALLPRGMKTLALTGCEKISASGVALLPPSLTTLQLPNAALIDDLALKAMPRSLIELDIGFATLITDAGFELLPLATLRRLNVKGASRLTDTSAYLTSTEATVKFPPSIKLNWANRA